MIHSGSIVRHLRRALAPAEGRDASDAELLARFVTNADQTAFELIVRRHERMVFGVCQRVLRDRQAAEDAFQAAFLALARKAASIRQGEALSGWLYKVACRVALKARAGADLRARQVVLDPALDARPARAGHPSDAHADAVWRELRAVLDEELSRLPEKFRTPVVLCYLEGKSYAEAASLAGCPKGTLSGRLTRARGLLAARLARRGVSITGALLASALWGQAHAVAARTTLLDATALAAVRLASGEPVARVAPTAVAHLADGVVRAMFTTKIKIAAGVLAVVLACGGVAGLAYQAASSSGTTEPGADLQGAQAAQRGEAVRRGEKTRPRYDLQGDPLPPGARARVGSRRLHHGGLVTSVRFDVSGKVLVSGAADQTVRFWDRGTGKELGRTPLSGYEIRDLSFSRNGNVMAALDWQIHIFDGASRKRLRSMPENPDPNARFQSAVVTPDGKAVVAGFQDRENNNAIVFFDAGTGRELRRLKASKGAPGRPLRVVLAPDGKTIASTDSVQAVRLWDAGDGKELRRLPAQGAVWGLAFSPDGKTLATAGKDLVVQLWSVGTGKEMRRLLLPPRPPVPGAAAVAPFVEELGVSVAFSPDGGTLAVATEVQKGGAEVQTIHLLDVPGWKEVRRLSSSHDYYWHFQPSLSFSPDGQWLAAGSGPGVRLWDVATGKERFEEWHRPLTSPVLAPDGKLLATADWDGNIDLWDAASGRAVRRLTGHVGRVAGMIFSPDGSLVSAGVDDTVRFWDVAAGQEVRRLSHRLVPGFVAFGPRSQALAYLEHDAFTGTNVRGKATVIAHLLDLGTGKEVRRLEGQMNPDRHWPFLGLAVSPGGKVLAVGEAGAPVIRLWDLTTGKEMPSLTAQVKSPQFSPPSVTGLAFSADGRLLADWTENSDRPLGIWDVATGRAIRRIAVRSLLGSSFIGPRPGSAPALAFSSDGRAVVASQGSKAVRLYEVATGEVRLTLGGHQGPVTSAAFAANRRTLVTTSLDNTALVWDLTAGFEGRQPSRRELEACWADLGGADAVRAYRAIRVLAGAPVPGVAFLAERLKPVRAADPGRMRTLIADLGSGEFARREKAGKQVEQLGFAAEPALRQTLAGRPSLEVRRRVQRLLEKLGGVPTLRVTRAVEALELMASAEARRHLQALARGAGESRLTLEARAALQRLEARPPWAQGP
jgi:RNA polymerase sigma factor (sigma-70 family)